MVYVYTNELTHYGILGMKWGIRRYQNPDGTLTAAGKKRYGSVENLEAGRTKKQAERHEKEKKAAIASGNTERIQKFSSELTQEEMQRAFQRINDKQKLADLRIKDLSAGKQKLNELIEIGGKVKTAGETITNLYNISAKAYNAFNKSGNKLPIIGEKEDKTAKEMDKAKLEWQKLVNEKAKRDLDQNAERWKWEQEKNADEASGKTKVYEKKKN